MQQDPFSEDDQVLDAEAEAEIGDEDEQRRPSKVPQHVANFYGRMNPRLDEKGVWGKSQVAKSMKALLLREQHVVAPRNPAPFGRLDRRRLVEKLVKEGKTVKVVPRNIRGTAGVIHPATVDSMLEALPDHDKSSPQAVTAVIGRFFGVRKYETIATRTLRAKRWMLNNPGRRVPMHVREGAVLSTAVALAVAALFPEQCEPEVIEAARLLREQHGMTEEAR